jgi:sterol desaturase/sphingolipid hydroxylase (fatty acid hydroxylase superfamily)
MPLVRYTQALLDAAQGWPPPDGARSEGARNDRKSVRVFESDWIEAFLARAHPVTPLLWFGPIVGFAAYRTLRADPSEQLLAAPLFVAGWLAWSLIEYVLHRFIFHIDAHTPKERLRAFLMHGYHHEFPDDKMRLVAPPLMSWPLAVVLAVLTHWFLGGERWLPAYAGMAVGYLAYDYIHYYTHHFRPRRGIGKWLRSYHMLHHYDNRMSRFGVSSPLWDFVFGTYEPLKRGRAAQG